MDHQLLRLLGQDARQNSETLARQLNISSATVRRRLRKLIRSGSLHIVGVVDPARFGLPLTAIIALDVAHEKLKAVMEVLVDRSEITWISTTTGRFDIIGPADRAIGTLVKKIYTIDLPTETSSANLGFSFKKEAFEYYGLNAAWNDGVTPFPKETITDPDGNPI